MHIKKPLLIFVYCMFRIWNSCLLSQQNFCPCLLSTLINSVQFIKQRNICDEDILGKVETWQLHICYEENEISVEKWYICYEKQDICCENLICCEMLRLGRYKYQIYLLLNFDGIVRALEQIIENASSFVFQRRWGWCCDLINIISV